MRPVHVADCRRRRWSSRWCRRYPGQASDLRVAAHEAKTDFLFARVGLAGADMGACAILPRIVGQGRAAELLFTGRLMRARKAKRWGFKPAVARGCACSRLRPRPRTQPRRGPRRSALHHQALAGRGMECEHRQALDMEAEAQARCMQTKDFQPAPIEAFAPSDSPVQG